MLNLLVVFFNLDKIFMILCFEFYRIFIYTTGTYKYNYTHDVVYQLQLVYQLGYTWYTVPLVC